MENVTIEIKGQPLYCMVLRKELTLHKSAKKIQYGGFVLTYSDRQTAEADLILAHDSLVMEGEKGKSNFTPHILTYGEAAAKLVID